MLSVVRAAIIFWKQISAGSQLDPHTAVCPAPPIVFYTLVCWDLCDPMPVTSCTLAFTLVHGGVSWKRVGRFTDSSRGDDGEACANLLPWRDVWLLWEGRMIHCNFFFSFFFFFLSLLGLLNNVSKYLYIIYEEFHLILILIEICYMYYKGWNMDIWRKGVHFHKKFYRKSKSLLISN